MNLLRYRCYCLGRNRQIWAILPLLLLMSLALSRAGNGHLFLIPSVLCCLTACGDYDNVATVLKAGYSRRQIHVCEIWWILGLNLLLCAAVTLLPMKIPPASYLCKLILLTAGNCCVFLALAVTLRRKESLLVPGFLMTALEAGVQGNFLAYMLRNLFPSAGLTAPNAEIYILESLILLLLIHVLPFYIPSKIRAN